MKASSSEISSQIAWSKEYQPWMLFARAMMLVGKQVGPLMLAYWKICEWNPSHYLVTCSCRRETFGWLAYPCEGTKAFARCFPLLAISVSLVVTGRFILQSRIYYHLLARKAILDFQNYKVYKDPAVLLLVFCFSMGCLHFALDVFHPPYLVNDMNKLGNICQFAVPCVVFFVVFESGCNIEKHLVTLNRFYEDDPVWAKEQLDGVKFFSEEHVRQSSRQACEGLQSHGVGECALDTLLDDTVRRAVTFRGPLDLDDDASNATRAGLFEGLWPGRVLLHRGLNDPISQSFKISMRVFMGIFVVMHAVVLGLLTSSAIREFGDTLPDNRPTGALHLGDAYYVELGMGYCRDESMQRPDCYWVTWDKAAQGPLPAKQDHAPVESASLQKPRLLNSRRNGHAKYYHPAMVPGDGERRQTMFLSASANATARGTLAPAVDESLPEWIKPQKSKAFEERQIDFCGKECSSNKKCIGFSLDPEYCSVYNSQYVKAPSGWENSVEVETRSSSSARRNSFIVQGSNYDLATCWGSATLQGKPQDVVGGIVTLLNILAVIVILFSTFRYIIGLQGLKCW